MILVGWLVVLCAIDPSVFGEDCLVVIVDVILAIFKAGVKPHLSSCAVKHFQMAKYFL